MESTTVVARKSGGLFFRKYHLYFIGSSSPTDSDDVDLNRVADEGPFLLFSDEYSRKVAFELHLSQICRIKAPRNADTSWRYRNYRYGFKIICGAQKVTLYFSQQRESVLWTNLITSESLHAMLRCLNEQRAFLASFSSNESSQAREERQFRPPSILGAIRDVSIVELTPRDSFVVDSMFLLYSVLFGVASVLGVVYWTMQRVGEWWTWYRKPWDSTSHLTLLLGCLGRGIISVVGERNLILRIPLLLVLTLSAWMISYRTRDGLLRQCFRCLELGSAVLLSWLVVAFWFHSIHTALWDRLVYDFFARSVLTWGALNCLVRVFAPRQNMLELIRSKLWLEEVDVFALVVLHDIWCQPHSLTAIVVRWVGAQMMLEKSSRTVLGSLLSKIPVLRLGDLVSVVVAVVGNRQLGRVLMRASFIVIMCSWGLLECLFGASAKDSELTVFWLLRVSYYAGCLTAALFVTHELFLNFARTVGGVVLENVVFLLQQKLGLTRATMERLENGFSSLMDTAAKLFRFTIKALTACFLAGVAVLRVLIPVGFGVWRRALQLFGRLDGRKGGMVVCGMHLMVFLHSLAFTFGEAMSAKRDGNGGWPMDVAGHFLGMWTCSISLIAISTNLRFQRFSPTSSSVLYFVDLGAISLLLLILVPPLRVLRTLADRWPVVKRAVYALAQGRGPLVGFACSAFGLWALNQVDFSSSSSISSCLGFVSTFPSKLFSTQSDSDSSNGARPSAPSWLGFVLWFAVSLLTLSPQVSLKRLAHLVAFSLSLTELPYWLVTMVSPVWLSGYVCRLVQIALWALQTLAYTQGAPSSYPRNVQSSVVEVPEPDDLFGESDCSICLESVVDGEVCLVLPCKHSFHQKCISDWFRCKNQQVCPNCRYKVMVFDSLFQYTHHSSSSTTNRVDRVSLCDVNTT